MKAHEALSALEAGEKIRRKDWDKNQYLYLNEDNFVKDQNGHKFVDVYGKSKLTMILDDNWEIYDDRKEIPEQLNYLKDLYKQYQEKDFCKVLQCNNCPLEIRLKDNTSICTTLDKILNRINKEFKLNK